MSTPAIPAAWTMCVQPATSSVEPLGVEDVALDEPEVRVVPSSVPGEASRWRLSTASTSFVVDEPSRKRRADEAGAAGDEDALARQWHARIVDGGLTLRAPHDVRCVTPAAHRGVPSPRCVSSSSRSAALPPSWHRPPRPHPRPRSTITYLEDAHATGGACEVDAPVQPGRRHASTPRRRVPRAGPPRMAGFQARTEERGVRRALRRASDRDRQRPHRRASRLGAAEPRRRLPDRALGPRAGLLPPGGVR